MPQMPCVRGPKCADAASAPEGSASAPEAEKEEDPTKALEDAIKKDAGKK